MDDGKIKKSGIFSFGRGASGFTLLETLLAMGIFAAIAGFGLLVSMDVYRGNSLLAERNVLVSILQRARSQAMDNVDQARHGVHADAFGYTLFEGGSWAFRNGSLDITFEKSGSLAAAGFTDVVFNQLSGSADIPAKITLSDNGSGKTLTISVNNEGQINY